MKILRLIHSILIWIVGFLSMLACSVTAILLYYIDRSGDIPHIIGRVWGLIVLKISGIRVEFQGLENLDRLHPQLIMANHQGNFDIWILLAYLPIQFRWVIKHTLFRVPVLGPAMRRIGYIAMERDNPRQAVRALKEAQSVLESGRSVVIFPEGTRSVDGQVHEFKRGGFLLASRAKLPILPLTIDGSFDIMQRKTIIVNPRPVKITIHPPIPAEEIERMDQAELIRRIQQQIAQPLNAGARG